MHGTIINIGEKDIYVWRVNNKIIFDNAKYRF